MKVRAAVATAWAASSPRRHQACSSAAIAVASAAARYPSPARTMAIASLVLAGAVTVLTGVTSLLGSQADGRSSCWSWRFSWFLAEIAAKLALFLRFEFDSTARL